MRHMSHDKAMPQIFAHRGVSSEFQENTIAAFAAARERGADGVELDVRRSADGQLVVHHDPRLADGRPINSLTTTELPDHVPSLQAAMEACSGVSVNVEIKNLPGEPDFDPESGIVPQVAQLLREIGRIDDVIVSSFNFSDISKMRMVNGDIATGWLVLDMEDIPTMLDHVTNGGHRAIHPPAARTTAGLVHAAHERGVKVNTWTVDAPGLMIELANNGVDAIITNDPATARLTLSRWA